MTNPMTVRRRWLAPERTGWPALIFVASAVLLLVRVFTGDKLLPFLPDREFGFFDLRIYREAAQATLAGRPLYAARFQLGFGFTYPPFAVLAFLVLAAFPLRVDEVGVVALNLGFVAVIAHLTVALAQRSPGSEPPRFGPGAAWMAAGLALWTEPVISGVGYGQIDLLIAALVLADLTLGGRARWGGLGIGLAAALKLTPLIFIPFLILTGRGRIAVTALGGFLAAIGLSFALEPGDAWSYWGRALFQASRVTGHHPFAGRGPANQSLRGLLMRVAPSLPHLGDIWVVSCLLIGTFGLGLAVRVTRRGDEAWGFVLTAITGLLICPVSWTHHWVIAVPGLLLVALSPRRGFTGRLIAGAAVLCALGSPVIWLEIARDPSGVHLGVWGLLSGDLYVIAGLGAIIVTGVLEWRRAQAGVRSVWPRPSVSGLSSSPSRHPGHPGDGVRAVPTGHGVTGPRQSVW